MVALLDADPLVLITGVSPAGKSTGAEASGSSGHDFASANE